jgi:hypothetical protein
MVDTHYKNGLILTTDTHLTGEYKKKEKKESE